MGFFTKICKIKVWKFQITTIGQKCRKITTVVMKLPHLVTLLVSIKYNVPKTFFALLRQPNRASPGLHRSYIDDNSRQPDSRHVLLRVNITLLAQGYAILVIEIVVLHGWEQQHYFADRTVDYLPFPFFAHHDLDFPHFSIFAR